MATIIDPAKLRWITFSHYEADESGAMNEWLAVAPSAVIAHSGIGVRTTINDQADRPPHALADGDVLDLGGKRVRYIYTPHVPHGWDAGLIYEETTQTLFTSDLFTRTGDNGVTTDADIVGPALTMEDHGHATALTPQTAPTIRRLAQLPLQTLAIMHAPAYKGNGAQALEDLATGYESRLTERPLAPPACRGAAGNPSSPSQAALTELVLRRTIPAYAPRSITRIQGTSTAILWTAVPISGT